MSPKRRDYPQHSELSVPEKDADVRTQALLHIALVCKVLEEPAMDKLWGALDTFTPLLRLLPSVKLMGETYVLHGPLCSGEWARFDHYAARARALTLVQHTPNVPVIADPSVYLRILQEHAGPVLPRLRSLVCLPLVTEAVIFLTQTLRYINFESADTCMALTFLSSVGSKASRVEDLRITLTGVFDSSIYSCIAKFRTVPELELSWRNSPLSEYVKLDGALAKFRLSHLSITGSNRWEKDIENDLFAPGFRDLKSFTIEGGFRLVNAAIARVQSTQLSKLQIIHVEDPFGPLLEWRPLVDLIFSRWWSSLTCIFLDLQYSSATANIGLLFESINRLHNLQTFTLWHYWPICISDEDIENLRRIVRR
ncbi:hypothetical protein B0H13DRAFT_2329232 [Mycena leptocephala]|nr:hypothetical protein B0H13DRAFT_2329232 [Mycena leptocephala]